MRLRKIVVAAAMFALVSACGGQTTRQGDDRAQAQDQAQAEAMASAQLQLQARESRAMSAMAMDGRRAYAPPPAAMPMPEQDRENYARIDENGVMRAAETPVSTFSVDVDTGSYANVRRLLREGQMPRGDAVRVEEMINYFDYGYAPPKDRSQPFSLHTEIAPTPWNAKTQLLRIGLQGWRPQGELPAANLVFLVDVSGSMYSRDKLPLVKASLKLLVQQLGARDRISLVTYGSTAEVVLEPTPGNQQATIVAAIERMQAEGGTNGASGIQLAYAMARQGRIENGINRVMLATDGDFNVGVTNFEQLKEMVVRERKSGIALSTLGYGRGNYNDHLMEQLADAGNGNYSYIDGIEEARRALVQSRAATLLTIASDVKIQVEFNPAVVAEYRLIGYENRALQREDFANDQVDAGEIGAGHSVTALYEIALVGSGGERIEPLRYGAKETAAQGGELAHLRLRYKRPGESESRLIEQPLLRKQMLASSQQASESFRFAAAVAAFGQTLRGGRYTGDYRYDQIVELAHGARGDDPDGWRAEFVRLVQLTKSFDATDATGQGGATGECGSERGCE